MPGAVLRTREDTSRLIVAQRSAVADHLAETLVALHAVNPAEVALSDFGCHDGYCRCQMATWRAEWERFTHA